MTNLISLIAYHTTSLRYECISRYFTPIVKIRELHIYEWIIFT